MSDFPPNLSIRPLTVEDVAQCLELEQKGFPENERGTEAKFRYRLTTCPELCSGLFIRDYEYKYNAINLPEVAEKLNQAHGDANDDDELDKLPVKSSVTKETLIGHIIATKTYHRAITDASMELPSKEDPTAGHIESLRYIGIHALVIDPEWHGKNLGTLLMHDYIQKLSNQDLGDKVILIAHEQLTPFYEKIGFTNLGKSKCEFAGSTWYDLAIDLIAEDDL
ncbi:acyl-CoA N-acyltransferase [Suhomyces tanzawaensis NRRL Y-17324]|uniref:Acyl-CoA N-acyltransferase n=1 Tax=Suhomyces tanzawaensis NRRL Y-17324 TaxID=984487 RepID=A0A1E4SCC8_9ASCO|nr:acyl-CoA N-acyltransferase [Suhomyces tanzawaensis NRRL Y-17324]ODV77167.1 acyl-CoA N-acyltransferase [Suhomyces tanzawaensis NRRL Y-17324]